MKVIYWILDKASQEYPPFVLKKNILAMKNVYCKIALSNIMNELVKECDVIFSTSLDTFQPSHIPPLNLAPYKNGSRGKEALGLFSLKKINLRQECP